MRGGAAAPPARGFAWCTTGSRHFLGEQPALSASADHGVTPPPRRIEFDCVARSRHIDLYRVFAAVPAELEATLDIRPTGIPLAWNTSFF
jgi:hypothetical protein